MRVLVVTSMYPTPRFPMSGTFVAEQVRALRDAGVDVDLFRIEPRTTRLDYGLKIVPLARRLRAGAYDVVHTHHTYSLFTVEMARKLAGARMPLVLTSHEGEVLDRPGRTRTWHPTSRLRHSIGLKRLAARWADFVIFVSSQVAAAVAPNVRYAVIPCGVDLARFRPLDRAGCRARLGLASNAKVVFFPHHPSGRAKRFSLVRAAVDAVRVRAGDCVLVTAGTIPNGDMPVYYNAADVVVQASYYEASPTVIKEALACETPLVSTDSGDVRHMIDGLRDCYISDDDPAAMARFIAACFGRRAIGGRERLRRLGLGLDQTAERIARVYRTLT